MSEGGTITWATTGGTVPRTATIEIFGPQTNFNHPADFHPIVEGKRDTGMYRWTVAVPQQHDTGSTMFGPQNPVPLPGFHIRFTDVCGESGSDTTPTFAIIRR